MNLASTLADNSASSLGPWWIVLYVRKSREGISYLLSYNCTVLCYYVGNHTNYPILYQLTYEHLNRSVGYAVNLALHIVVQTKAPVCTFRNTLIVMESHGWGSNGPILERIMQWVVVFMHQQIVDGVC